MRLVTIALALLALLLAFTGTASALKHSHATSVLSKSSQSTGLRKWSCAACTFRNEDNANHCAMCYGPKPRGGNCADPVKVGQCVGFIQGAEVYKLTSSATATKLCKQEDCANMQTYIGKVMEKSDALVNKFDTNVQKLSNKLPAKAHKCARTIQHLADSGRLQDILWNIGETGDLGSRFREKFVELNLEYSMGVLAHDSNCGNSANMMMSLFAGEYVAPKKWNLQAELDQLDASKNYVYKLTYWKVGEKNGDPCVRYTAPSTLVAAVYGKGSGSADDRMVYLYHGWHEKHGIAQFLKKDNTKRSMKFKDFKKLVKHAERHNANPSGVPKQTLVKQDGESEMAIAELSLLWLEYRGASSDALAAQEPSKCEYGYQLEWDKLEFDDDECTKRVTDKLREANDALQHKLATGQADSPTVQDLIVTLKLQVNEQAHKKGDVYMADFPIDLSTYAYSGFVSKATRAMKAYKTADEDRYERVALGAIKTAERQVVESNIRDCSKLTKQTCSTKSSCGWVAESGESSAGDAEGGASVSASSSAPSSGGSGWSSSSFVQVGLRTSRSSAASVTGSSSSGSSSSGSSSSGSAEGSSGAAEKANMGGNQGGKCIYEPSDKCRSKHGASCSGHCTAYTHPGTGDKVCLHSPEITKHRYPFAHFNVDCYNKDSDPNKSMQSCKAIDGCHWKAGHCRTKL